MKTRKTIFLICGCALLALFVLMGFFPSLFTSYGRKEMFSAWEQPSHEHIFGTNDMGYDIFTEIVYGARETLFIGVLSSVIALLLGAAIGVLAAKKNFVGKIFNGVINIFVLLPKFVCLIVLAVFVGNGYVARVGIIAAFGWVSTARAVRAQTIKIRNSDFIETLVIQGYDKFHIAIFHVLPNLGEVLPARYLSGVSGCIMMESSLSFLGIGDLFNPTWGTMVNLAFRRGAFLQGAYNWLLIPGACIALLVLAFYLISVGVKKNEY